MEVMQVLTKLRLLPGPKASWVAGDATHDAWHDAAAVKCHKNGEHRV